MVAEDPSDVNPDIVGGAQIAATIAGMPLVVKGDGEGWEVECVLCFSGGLCVPL